MISAILSVMPCPFFEPQRIASAAHPPGGRLPLIDEYEGLCHAASEPVAAPDSASFRWCNHGNSKGCCQHFPTDEKRSCLRYDVIEREDRSLRVLCIEEQAYAPLRWYRVQYICGEERLEPEVEDFCIRSQVIAFCRSYLARFPVLAAHSG
ncbi:MAG TPA: hypothetical protein VFA65_14800 [Bryobacteraceae bacterium]|nr:hypothetical protein [Bryobacteraceae bacterium]